MHLSIRKSENWSDKAAEMKVIMQQSTMMINSDTNTFIPCTSPIAGCTRSDTALEFVFAATSCSAISFTLASTWSALGICLNLLQTVCISSPAKRTASFHLPVYLRFFRCVSTTSSCRLHFSTVSPQHELPTFPDVMS